MLGQYFLTDIPNNKGLKGRKTLDFKPGKFTQSIHNIQSISQASIFFAVLFSLDFGGKVKQVTCWRWKC